jgi:Ca2+-binding RTX toxin-like protein
MILLRMAPGLVAAAVLAAAPTPAQAGTVDAMAGVSFTAGAAEANEVTVSVDDTGIVTVRDDGALLRAQTGCSSTGPHTATCKPMLGADPLFTAYLGDADDTLIGSRGSDQIDGGDGIDVLDGGKGSDVISGGAGEDIADYSGRADAIRVALNGRPVSGSADDGRVGARDTVDSDVEDVWGGRGDDTLIGNDRGNLLNGGPGADDLQGGAGEDAADYSERATGVVVQANGKPESGNDEDGPAGARDKVATDIEDLLGGAGNDTLVGDGEKNWLGGGDGDDVLDARGAGADYSSCGSGSDIGWVDPNDIAASDCERIGAGPEPIGGGPDAPDTSPAQVRLRLARGQTLRTAPKALTLLFTCSESCSVVARLTLQSTSRGRVRPGRGVVANAASALTHAGGGSFTFRLASKARRMLRAAKRADLAISLSAKDGAANVTRVRRHLQLLPTKARLAAPKQSPRAPFHGPPRRTRRR